ncbi:uncharacterized protein LOC122664245 isoform X2 [Telopea speciosissima]|uniref:uncharacterized protein LOC122664245 isoform X2 n=1 Tax=Telopea speciosissima TaxID=54955 RepID=UPI001CC33C11|nr:uncharacterized protein LOC122664245 isoform X2 [Telopea speciosissima]
MKRRSHRLPISDPPDDWGDGSWTVDCVCGVNFDDGEEMVNCDECGVWVHTRCSRFVKGETSFACDKCKNKKKRNDSEETEVAQLLVELPTKTLRMNTSYPSSVPSRPSFRLWTDIPIEERVHVQGIPGGDPALFRGLSSVFTPELWKCTGYVPKKFNVQYKEFPSWDENRVSDARIEEENENLVDKGAGVLFSLSKEIISAPSMETSIGLRGPFDETGGERNASLKDMKKREAKDYSVGRMQNSVKKERDQLRPVGVSGKRKKEDYGTFKDRSGMKKARSSDKEADNKKRASGHAHGAHKLEFSEVGVKIKTDSFDVSNEHRTESVLPVPDLEATTNTNKTLNVSSAKPYSTERILSDNCRDAFPREMEPSPEKVDNQVPSRNENYPITGCGALSVLELNDAGCIEPEKEDVKTAVDDTNRLTDGNYDPRDLNGGSSSVAVDSQNTRPLASKLSSTTAEVQEYQMLQDSHGCSPPISVQSTIKLKIGGGDEHLMKDSVIPSSPITDVKNDTTKFSTTSLGRSALAQVHDTILGSLPFSEHKAQDNERESKELSHTDWENIDERMVSVSDEPQKREQEIEGSIGPATLQEGSSEPKCVLQHAEEPVKLGETQPSPPAQHTQHKVVAGVVKSSSTSSTVVISKLSVSGSSKAVVASTPPRPSTSTKRVKMISFADTRRVHAVSDVVRDDLRHEVARKTAKDSVLKTQQTSKSSQAALSKRPPTDSKELVSNASLRSPVGQSVATVSSGFVESTGSLQTQGASHMQSKITASGFSKGEKFSQSSSQLSSKSNNSPPMHPPAPVISSAALSDEELALLLHQELNSSPRVPRVPRVRAGSIPPLASPAISLLIKRSSGSGSKDQVSRRKNKEDASKDDRRSSREPSDDPKKIDRVTSCLDQRRQDPVLTTDGSTSREICDRSLELVHSGKKNMPSASPIANSGPSSSNETNDQNLSSIRNSPREIADDDIGTISGHAPSTLPGLVNLRKHNGEQYASSQSQAVLDCLRNHNEWPQLVDRGPKTNAGRKRQKLDAEPSMTDLENEVDRGRYPRELEGKSVDSQQEDFPKGKRKARKRRRLALQGRGIKDVRKGQKVAAITDDDFGPFSYSSEGTEGIFSEDESQGVRACPVGSEASTGSDEQGLM